jgi:hypothetical protein
MNRNRIKLLVTLVLFILAATSAWMTSQADARGLTGPGASSHLSASRPGVDLAAGDPDDDQGIAPQPPPNTKSIRGMAVGGSREPRAFVEWIRWTGRIWATLYLRATR